tara:strand:+ start:86 stop:1726 length:1641 start_codon:yes stop_codon:yes gene_type:complete
MTTQNITINDFDGLISFLRELFGGIDETTLLTDEQHNVPLFDVVDPITGFTIVDTSLMTNLKTNVSLHAETGVQQLSFMWLMWPGGGFSWNEHGLSLHQYDPNNHNNNTQASRTFPVQLEVTPTPSGPAWSAGLSFGDVSLIYDTTVDNTTFGTNFENELTNSAFTIAPDAQITNSVTVASISFNNISIDTTTNVITLTENGANSSLAPALRISKTPSTATHWNSPGLHINTTDTGGAASTLINYLATFLPANGFQPLAGLPSPMFGIRIGNSQNIYGFDISIANRDVSSPPVAYMAGIHGYFLNNVGVAQAPGVPNNNQQAQSQAQATGDPYITTFSGITYKMDDFTGFVRLLQGEYEGKMFTINAENKLLTKSEIKELLEWRQTKMQGMNFSNNVRFGKFPAYFSKFYVSHGDKYAIVDANSLKILESNYKILLDNSIEINRGYAWSNTLKTVSRADLKIDKFLISFMSYEDKDIRNGIKLFNMDKLKNRSGALEHPIYVKDMKLRTIRSVVPIKQILPRKNKKIVKEEIIENGMKTQHTFKVF